MLCMSQWFQPHVNLLYFEGDIRGIMRFRYEKAILIGTLKNLVGITLYQGFPVPFKHFITFGSPYGNGNATFREGELPPSSPGSKTVLYELVSPLAGSGGSGRCCGDEVC